MRGSKGQPLTVCFNHSVEEVVNSTVGNGHIKERKGNGHTKGLKGDGHLDKRVDMVTVMYIERVERATVIYELVQL